ncbi:hypothetical protein GCM10022379_39010 [Micromonospora maritima]
MTWVVVRKVSHAVATIAETATVSEMASSRTSRLWRSGTSARRIGHLVAHAVDSDEVGGATERGGPSGAETRGIRAGVPDHDLREGLTARLRRFPFATRQGRDQANAGHGLVRNACVAWSSAMWTKMLRRGASAKLGAATGVVTMQDPA